MSDEQSPRGWDAVMQGKGGPQGRGAGANGPTVLSRLPPVALGLGLVIGAGLLGAWIRFAAVEPSWIGFLCDPGTGPWWCAPRRALIWGFHEGLLGLPALALALGALACGPSRARAALGLGALCLGGFGLVLYNTGVAAVAVILALLSAARR
ncbi:MAG: hypothetical protein JNK11_05670 [Alphaproteobacteria bacterium]|nr:hypothetical protein [Alphaproteobacteria bacterium]